MRGQVLCLRPRGGPVSASCTTILFVDQLQLVVPEKLPIAVVEQDIEGRVVGVAPPMGDGSLPAPQGRLTMTVSDLHPLAD